MKPFWDNYAHIYIQALNDYMNQSNMQYFEDPKLQNIYNLGRFIK